MPSPNKKVNQVAISDEERCFATLIASGLWTQADAHRMSFKDSKLRDDSQRRMLGSNMAKRPQIISYIQTALLSYVQEKNKGGSASFNFNDLDIGEDGAVSKESLRKAIIANISSETDTAKRQKMIMDLATLDGRKGDNDTGISEEQRLMYVPVRCVEHCKLYKAEKERREKLKDK